MQHHGSDRNSDLPPPTWSSPLLARGSPCPWLRGSGRRRPAAPSEHLFQPSHDRRWSVPRRASDGRRRPAHPSSLRGSGSLRWSNSRGSSAPPRRSRATAARGNAASPTNGDGRERARQHRALGQSGVALALSSWADRLRCVGTVGEQGLVPGRGERWPVNGGAPSVVWTSLGPLLWWVPGPTTRWAPGTTRLVLHGTCWRGAQGV
jgi:hypothetical protein